jgi:hypothetical protein
MNKQIIRLVKPVSDIVDLHATSLPVGGFFTPERSAINPLYLADESAMKITNIYLTLPPEERDGRTLWNYLYQVQESFPEDILQKGYRIKSRAHESDRPLLRTAQWSIASPSSAPFFTLGLTDDRNYRLPQADVAIVQVRNYLKDELLDKLSESSGKDTYQVVNVDTPDAFDKVLTDSRAHPLFQSLQPLREKYQQIGPYGVMLHLTREIDAEERLQELEKELGGRDIGTLSEEEQERLFKISLGSRNSKEK